MAPSERWSRGVKTAQGAFRLPRRPDGAILFLTVLSTIVLTCLSALTIRIVTRRPGFSSMGLGTVEIAVRICFDRGPSEPNRPREEPMAQVESRCPNCGSTRKKKPKPRRYHVWRCLDCGTLFRTSNRGKTSWPISEEEASGEPPNSE